MFGNSWLIVDKNASLISEWVFRAFIRGFFAPTFARASPNFVGFTWSRQEVGIQSTASGRIFAKILGFWLVNNWRSAEKFGCWQPGFVALANADFGFMKHGNGRGKFIIYRDSFPMNSFIYKGISHCRAFLPEGFSWINDQKLTPLPSLEMMERLVRVGVPPSQNQRHFLGW